MYDTYFMILEVLEHEGANATLRDTRGADIDAACGQLRVREQGEAELSLG